MQQQKWHDIYTQLSPQLLGICRRYIKDLSTAEDIVHDSFIVAIQKEDNLKNKASINGWLCKIVINRAINHLKNEKKIKYSNADHLEFIDETTMTNTAELDKKSSILASDFGQEDLLQAIDSLSENHKSVFNLYIIDQFSHLEISKLLNISVGTSKSSLSRARANVQVFLISKLHNNNTNEKKKRRIALLLFLGLGNHLFASGFRKSFRTFEIQPKKAFDLSRTIDNSVLGFNANPSKYFAVFKIAFLAFAVVGLLLYFVHESANPLKNENQTVNEQPILTDYMTDSIKNTVEKTNSIITQKKAINPMTTNVLISKNKAGIKNPKSVLKTIAASKLTSIIKDTITIQEAQKMVVIKKQIVKRDTVYVQK